MKKTKIVATISDKNCTRKFIENLYANGLNVVRLNTAHQSTTDALKVIEIVRQVSDKIAILIDTKGPEIRIGDCGDGIAFRKGEEVLMKGKAGQKSTKECLFVNYSGFVKEIQTGSQILIDDGYIILSTLEKKEDAVLCRFETDSVVKSRKSVNVPNTDFGLPSINDKDREFIQFAIEQDIDFIAHSFVRNKKDVLAVQEILDQSQSDIKIIAKIENQQGVDNVDEILDAAYGIMVARGDLSVEIPFEKTPGVQKKLIEKCVARRKPVIIATQMLHSMIDNPRPTRAEVSDIAGAVYSQADALMLSGETAFGKYPVEAIATMSKIAAEVENSKEKFLDTVPVFIHCDISAFLTKASVEASVNLNARAIVADTILGRTIRNIAGYRGEKPVYAICYSHRTMRELALTYGAFPRYMDKLPTSHEFLHESLRKLLVENKISKKDLVVVLAGNFGVYHGASYIEVGAVENLISTGQF
ncbi:MAG: pyruvate kinase [Bacteroidales bacterium]|nr:pyruvate kinase [Bacteroidales bacterium]MCF8457573.1 pyruvate kinase [Bacteroidales bacterium]